MLCMNRILGEPGISRIIASHYKDMLACDIQKRMDVLVSAISSSQRVTRSTDSAWHEVFTYMKHYSDHIGFLKFSIDHLIDICKHDEFLKPKIADIFLCFIAGRALKHRKELSKIFIAVLCVLFKPTRFETTRSRLMNSLTSLEWKNAAIDQVLDLPGLAQMMVDLVEAVKDNPDGLLILVFVLALNLHARPASRHHRLGSEFYAKVRNSALRMDQGAHEIPERIEDLF
jgi:hypothetical protein